MACHASLQFSDLVRAPWWWFGIQLVYGWRMSDIQKHVEDDEKNGNKVWGGENAEEEKS